MIYLYQQHWFSIVDLVMIFTIGEKRTQRINYISLNNYHKNVKLTMEVNPTKLLETHLFNQIGTYITQVNRKETETPKNLSSCIL